MKTTGISDCFVTPISEKHPKPQGLIPLLVCDAHTAFPWDGRNSVSTHIDISNGNATHDCDDGDARVSAIKSVVLVQRRWVIWRVDLSMGGVIKEISRCDFPAKLCAKAKTYKISWRSLSVSAVRLSVARRMSFNHLSNILQQDEILLLTIILLQNLRVKGFGCGVEF